MRLNLRHEFACTPEQLWTLLEDKEVDLAMVTANNGSGAWVDDRTEGDTRVIVKRVEVNRDIPGPMKKVLGTDRITYDLVVRRPAGSDRQEWSIRPMVLADRFSGSGTTTIKATAGGCVRVIEGELAVRVPLLGGKMEARLVDDVTKSYDVGADVLRRIIAERHG